MAAAPASSCEIARIPEDILAASIARTTPRDASRVATVSPAFRAAADSDAVWACFLPGDLPPLADGELSPAAPPSNKELFTRLSDSGSPVLLADRLMSMWLDRDTGAKCYMLSARALTIVWSCTPRYWRWIPLADSRFSEAAELLDVCWLEIRGKIHCKMLSRNSTYAAYMVFKISDESYYGLDYPAQEAAVTIGEGSKITRRVCLQGREPPPMVPVTTLRLRRLNRPLPPRVAVPKESADGWMEMEMGEFDNEEGEDGEVSISLMETRGGHWKKGLIVQGIEVRAKK